MAGPFRAALPLLVLLAASGAARADGPVTLRMEGWWGGLKGADILFTSNQTKSAWSGEFLVQAAGLLRWLTRLEADARGHGPEGPEGAAPLSYLQHVVSNKSDRTVELGFGGEPPLGRRLRDVETYADPDKRKRDPENVPDLAEAQRRDTMDPIAAILVLGRRALAGERTYLLNVYDGRRRFDLSVEVRGRATHGLFGRPTETIDAVAIVHPVAGFKPFHYRWWSDARFEVYLDPSSGLPLRISSSSFLASAVLSATAMCPPAPDCATH